MTATPATVAAPGHTVRLRVQGGLCYSSPRMTAPEAGTLAKKLANELFMIGASQRFVEFDDVAAGKVQVRGNRVTAIEARTVSGAPS